MQEYYLTKMEHSPSTLRLTDEKILKLSIPQNEKGNWVLHNENNFLTCETLEDIQKYIKEQENESNKN